MQREYKTASELSTIYSAQIRHVAWFFLHVSFYFLAGSRCLAGENKEQITHFRLLELLLSLLLFLTEYSDKKSSALIWF